MIDLRVIDELTRRLGDALPPGLAQTKEEMETQFRKVLTGAFERMNLVGREEFEQKCAELEDAQTKLVALEERIRALSPGE